VRAEVAQPVQYLTTDMANGLRSQADVKNLSCNLFIQTGSGAHPASCTIGTGGPFPGGKAWPGRDADRLTPSSAEVVNEEVYILSPYVYMAVLWDCFTL
jgi:hypothetical protein